MRKDLSNSDILTDNGSLNHKYFLSKRGQYWTKDHQDLLVKGIEEYGVGNWSQINAALYNEKSNEVELGLRACILLSINDIGHYQGMKLNEQQQREESVGNQERGKKENKLKDNIYIKL